MHYRKKYPRKVQGNKCWMCQGEKMLGNSRKWWGSDHHHQPTKSERKHVDLVQEGWA